MGCVPGKYNWECDNIGNGKDYNHLSPELNDPECHMTYFHQEQLDEIRRLGPPGAKLPRYVSDCPSGRYTTFSDGTVYKGR